MPPATSQARPPARLGYRSEKGRETVEFWKTQLLASKRQWENGDEERDRIRTMISELRFPTLMMPRRAPTEANKHDPRNYPHVDQIDLNLPLRYVQKLTSNIGDEQPEVRSVRDWTRPWEQHAAKWDVLTQRMMSQAGAPENNAEGAKDACTDGITTYWVNFTYNLSADDLWRATEAVDQVIERILKDPEAYEPANGADHHLMAEVLEARALDAQTAMRDPSGLVANALQLASTKHYIAANRESEQTWRWRSTRLRMEHERLPYGTHALMDHSINQYRYTRWVARLIRIPTKDARQHPAFHPKIRRELEDDVYADGTMGEKRMETIGTRSVDQDGERWRGMCSIWEIHDRKHLEILYLNFQCDRFLNAGKRNGVSRMRHPFVDENNRPIIPAMGPYPGFFPCDFFAPSLPKRDDEYKKLGQPLLKPGMPLIYALTKLLSHYVNTVKRASSAIYEAHPKLPDAARRAIKAGVDGTVFQRPADVPPGESINAVEWKPPSEQLFRQIHELIGQWCMVQSFPMAELTTQPVADTATQEKIGISAGDVWMNEVLRKFEVSYAVQCHIAMHLAMTFTTKSDWAALIGLSDATTLHALVTQIRFPPELPKVRYASRQRSADPVRITQLMSFDERLATDVDPVFQLPKWDRDHIMQEIARGLEVGHLPRYLPTEAQKKLITEMKARELQPDPQQPAPSGAAPARAGGGNGSVESRPATNGSPGGSASQARTPESARRSRRGGRRGRSGGPPQDMSASGATMDTQKA